MQPVSLNQFVAFFFHAGGRIGRREYALGLGFIYALSLAVLTFVLIRMSDQPPVVALLFLQVPLTVALLVLMAKRCHDLGLPGSFVLLVLVPIAGIVWRVALAFLSGNAGANAYGMPPAFRPE